MKLRRLATALALYLSATAFAQDSQSMRQGLEFGNSIAPQSNGQIVNPASNSSAWSTSGVPTAVPSGLGTFSQPTDGATAHSRAKSLGLAGLGNAAMDRCEHYAPTGNAQADQECAAVNFLSQRCLPARPGYPTPPSGSASCSGSFGAGQAQFDFANQVTERDSIFRAITDAQKNAENATGTTCQPETIVTKPAEYSNATCIKSTQTDKRTCSQVLQVTCAAPTDGCDAGGVVTNSWAGDMKTTFEGDGAGNYNLTFGTIADNYWGGWGATYDRNLNFEIKDVGMIKHFILTRAAFDDWLMVKVNGTVAYVGPHGGDRLEVVNRRITANEMAPRQCSAYSDEYSTTYACGLPESCGWDCGYYLKDPTYYETCTPIAGGWQCSTPDPHNGQVQYGPNSFGSPELRTSWNFNLSVDLKPYLINGANTIFMRTIVAGGGEGAIVISTRQYCPRLCSTSWLNQCTELENKAGIKLGTP